MHIVAYQFAFVMATLFGCHGNVPSHIGKEGKDPSSARKSISYGENIVKIRLVYPEIFNEIRHFFGSVVPDVHK